MKKSFITNDFFSDMLFQLTLMEEALRTNPESLGISSPHTARVLAKTVDSREKELVGILKSRMSEPSKLRKEVGRSLLRFTRLITLFN